MDSSNSCETAGPSTASAIDRVEQVALVALFSWLVWRLLPADGEAMSLHVLLLLLSEAGVLVFVLARHPTSKISRSPMEWAVAFGATTAPLLVHAGEDLFLPQLGLVLLTAGWAMHFWAKLTLRRNFGVVAADRGVKTAGPYGIVRHPCTWAMRCRMPASSWPRLRCGMALSMPSLGRCS